MSGGLPLWTSVSRRLWSRVEVLTKLIPQASASGLRILFNCVSSRPDHWYNNEMVSPFFALLQSMDDDWAAAGMVAGMAIKTASANVMKCQYRLNIFPPKINSDLLNGTTTTFDGITPFIIVWLVDSSQP